MTYSANANPNATNSELDSKRIISYNDTNLPNGITTPKENELSSLQRDKLIEQYVELVVDGMDMNSLLQYAKDGITEYIVTLTDSELKEEVGNYDEELYDELVDNVTNETFIDVNNNGGKF